MGNPSHFSDIRYQLNLPDQWNTFVEQSEGLLESLKGRETTTCSGFVRLLVGCRDDVTVDASLPVRLSRDCQLITLRFLGEGRGDGSIVHVFGMEKGVT